MDGGVIKTQHGPTIAILHQYTYTGQDKTIHSLGQLEWYKNNVNDKSIKVAGGLQHILTNDGYVIPISIRDGLPYVALHPFTDEEWDSLPHDILTGDTHWDPSVLGLDLDKNKMWFDAIFDLPWISLPLHLMSLVITTRELLCKAIMFCIVGTPPNTLLMLVS